MGLIKPTRFERVGFFIRKIRIKYHKSSSLIMIQV
jgi:hypothetical protein